MSDANDLKRNAEEMASMDEEFSFSFAAPMQELHEIAIISIARPFCLRDMLVHFRYEFTQ